MIDEKQIPNNPIQRYLALYGTGTIQIETPPARQIDIYITNQGGNDLQVDFFDVSWNAVPPSQNVPAGGIGLVTCSGSNLCHAAIIVQSAECMISKVCFVHN